MRRLSLALLPLALFAVGCGGNELPALSPDRLLSALPESGPPAAALQRGRVAVRVSWPKSAPSRVVPGASLSVKIEVLRAGTTIASTLLVSPATTATLSEVPVGSVTVRATAYANAGGTGAALATADVPATVTDGQTATIAVPMQSTVQTVQVTPSSVTILLSILSWRQLTTTARNSGGTAVPVATSDWEFSSDAPLIANVSSSGVVTGLIPGTATVTVREKTSGKTAAVPVTVVL